MALKGIKKAIQYGYYKFDHDIFAPPKAGASTLKIDFHMTDPEENVLAAAACLVLEKRIDECRRSYASIEGIVVITGHNRGTVIRDAIEAMLKEKKYSDTLSFQRIYDRGGLSLKFGKP